MTKQGVTRKLTAILSADVKGYSRLMGEDEVATVRTMEAYRDVVAHVIAAHRGRVVDSTGDNVLAEFTSVLEAVECAVHIQKELKSRNALLPEHRRMEFRIGINLGDVIEEGERIYGDGVNIAARIEGLAEAGGICVTRPVYDQVKNKLDLEYEYLGDQQVKNIPEPVRVYRIRTEPAPTGTEPAPEAAEKFPRARRSRRFSVAVSVLVVALAALAVWRFIARDGLPPVEVASVENMAFPLPDKPSIAVLPFANMSGDPDQEYIADGITENIIASLSAVSEMFVIARNSTFTYKGRPVKVQQVSEDLGVRYVLEGSVQKSGDRVRITAQLIDATQGHHLWSKRYDRDMEDFFALQDEITKEIVVALQVELTDGEQARLWHKSTDNLETWGQIVRAGRLFERFNPEDNAKARELFAEVLEKEPENAFAWTMFAWTHALNAWLGPSGSEAESIERAVAAAKTAEELDTTRPEVHSLWSTIHLLQGNFDAALAAGQKAVTLGPSNSLSHILYANVALHAGEFGRAITLGEKAIRLTPYCPYWFLPILAESYRQAGRYREAEATYAKALERAREDKGNPLPATIGLVDVLVELGRDDEARNFASQLLRVDPAFNLEGFRKVYAYKDPAHVERMAVNLREAGLPVVTSRRVPDKPSVAVLPFVNMSGDPEQEYFSDGLTEDLITDLSRIPGAFVISRNSVFRYKGKTIKPEQVSEELGVRYILEGSVRKADDRVRITAQLIDAATGGHLWAERYDRALEDVFTLQDEITQQIVAAMKVNVTKAELERAMRKDTGDLNAYEYTLRGRWYSHHHTREANDQARGLFEKAIELDPNRARAYVGLGWTYYKDWAAQWSQDPQSLERAFELARQAVSLDDSSAGAHILMGHVYLWKKQHDLAIQEQERAIVLDPNDADGYADLGETLIWVGRPEEAIELLKKAMRLNPHHPVSYLFNLGFAYHLTGQYEEAVGALKGVLSRNPNYLGSHLALAVAYNEAGLHEEARAHVAEALRISPDLSLEVWRQRLPFKDPALLKRVLGALSEAGLK